MDQWYGIYTGILGFLANNEELERRSLDEPKDWPDLLDPKYKGLIWPSNYNTAGTAELVINTVIQMKGHDEGIQYLVDLDKNIDQYTKSGGGPSKSVGIGECTIGIGFLHDAIYQIADNGYDNIGLVAPSSGASYEVGASAGFEGCKHPNAAKLWLEYVLTPTCVNQAKEVGSYQFLVIDNAEQPQIAIDMGVDPDNVMDYDFAGMPRPTPTSTRKRSWRPHSAPATTASRPSSTSVLRAAPIAVVIVARADGLPSTRFFVSIH